MRRYSVVIVLLHATVFHLQALPAQRGWTLSPNVGLHWGEVQEIVYYSPTLEYPTSNEYYSLLIWELKNILMLGLDTRWESGRAVGIEFDFDTAIPGWHSGKMNDYDWLFTDRDWSHWSLSSIDLKWGFSLDASIDLRVIDKGPISLHLGLAYHLDTWAWTDTMENSIYSTGYDNHPIPFDSSSNHVFRDPEHVPNSIGVNAIDYEIFYHSLLAVFKVRVQKKKWFIEFAARIGPSLAHSMDFHKLRDGGNGLKYLNTGIGFPWIDGTIDVGVHFTERISLILRGEIAWKSAIRSHTIYYYPRLDIYKMTGYDAGGVNFLRGALSIQFSLTLDPLPHNMDL